MRFKYTKAQEFKRITRQIMEMFEEVLLIVDEDGLKIKMPTPSRVALLEFYMPSYAFEEYEVQGRKEYGLKLKHIYDVLKKVSGSDKLIMEETEDGRIKITLEGTSRRSVIIPVVDTSYEEVPELNLEFTARVKLLGKPFSNAIEEASIFSDSVKVITTKDKFTMISKNPTKGEYILEMTSEDPAVEEISTTEDEVKAVYGLDFLKKMVKYLEKTSSLEFNYSTDSACKIVYNIGEEIYTWYLAPRIEED